MEYDDHPVWTLYNELRTICLNVKYYERRLDSIERLNFWMDIALAISAPSSAIAKLDLWHTEVGNFFWIGMGIIAAVVSVIKPFLSLPKKIKEYEGLVSGYRMLYFDLREIKTLVEQYKRFDEKMQSDFQKALQREKTLIGKCTEVREKKNIKRICTAEVQKEYPPESFYVPKEPSDDKSH
jgi:hypothetical protein